MNGIRVLDVGQMVAGPVAATLLADMGAEVIKIEPPHGDNLRYFEATWLLEGRGKRSVTVDLRQERGRELVRRLASSCDVLVENFVPGTMERLGLGPEDLHRDHPALVYVRVSGYGQTGPYADRRAMDATALAFGGVSALLTDDPAGGGGGDAEPRITGNMFLADYTAAMLAALGAVEALRRRDASPERPGAVVDVSLYDALLRLTGIATVSDSLARTLGAPPRETTVAPAPWGPFRAADGRWVMICVTPGGDLFERFARAIDADWAFADGAIRPELQYTDRQLVSCRVAEWVGARSSDEVVEVLAAARIPASLVMTPDLLTADPHLRATGAFCEGVREDGVRYEMPAPIPRFDGRREPVRSTAPALGSATDDVLTELLGLSTDDLGKLRADHVISG